MKIEIHYCRPWHFETQAAGLAEELRRSHGIEAKLIPGTDGIFDVIVDGRCVFSPGGNRTLSGTR
jgi:predicted Rdx family selenoprotein